MARHPLIPAAAKDGRSPRLQRLNSNPTWSE